MKPISVKKLKNKIVKVLVENEIGSVRKAGWTPYSYNYGYLLDFLNPVDGENWDVIIPETKLKAGEKVEAKIIGIITQEEGDDNLIGLLSEQKLNKKELLKIEQEIKDRGYKNTKLQIF